LALRLWSANILCSLTVEVFQKHSFLYETFATTIAKTSHHRTVLDRRSCSPVGSCSCCYLHFSRLAV